MIDAKILIASIGRLATRPFSYERTRAKLSAAAQELLPLHVAVIMDGNGRWAKERGLPRIEGHRRGAESARAIIKAASEAGIRYLTSTLFLSKTGIAPKPRWTRS